MKNTSIYNILFLLVLFAFNVKGQQLELQNLNQPNSVCLLGSNQNLVVAFKNVGAVPVTFAQFETHINGLITGNMIWNGVLNPGNSTTVNLGLFTVTSNINDFLIIAYDANNSGSAYNDTTFYHVVGANPITPSYTDDFEGAINWGASNFSAYTSGYNPNGWELAVPNYGTVTPTIPGSKSWVIGLDSGYDNDISTYLYSPIFNFAASGINSIYLHFVANANLASGDSLTMEYTTDFLTWTQLPSAVTISGNTGGWNGYGTGLGFLASQPQVQLRFVFNSDGSGTADGIAIDDIEVIECVISLIDMNQLAPVSCFGMCDAALEAVPQIGFPPFTYLWNSGETTQSISNVCPGYYEVTVTDINGCTGTSFMVVSQPATVSSSLASSFSICQGNSALLCPTVIGGAAPFTYQWNTGAINSCISVNVSGTYSVTVTDANGCSAICSTTVIVNSLPVPVITGINSICQGASTTFNAGVGYSSYQWSNGITTQTVSLSVAGTYIVTVTDANGCTGTASLWLVVNQSPTVSLGPDQLICNGNSLILNAGFGFTSYQWSSGQFTQSIAVTTSGTYTVTVNDINGCSASDAITITQTTPIIITQHDVYNCIAQADSVYLIVTGGAGSPYTYNWSNGSTLSFGFFPPGNYSVVVTDMNGCTGSAVVSAASSLQINISKTDPQCFGFTGTIDASMNGKPPLTYQWSNGFTVPQLSNMPPGVYTVTVTDALGCSLSATDSLVNPEQIILTLDSVVASGCGASDGSFYYSFTPAGFSIPWVNGVQFGSTTNLTKGIYSIYIIQNVCTSNTLQVVVPDSCEDVWPGDANFDLTADNKDLLQIGLAYGNTGPVRPAASNVWVAQPAPDWSNWFNMGVNHKHADCDGNGIVDAADTIPVLLNYGLTHPLKPIIIPQVNTLAPDLYLVITQDTTGLSDSVFVNVMCGTATNPVDSIYALAFTLNFDAALTNASSAWYHINNTFMGTPLLDVISINKIFTSGYADFAITRTNHQNVSGYGAVCSFAIVTANNIAANSFLNFSLSNVTGITANASPVELDAFGDSIFMDSTLTAINNLSWEREVKVYPNPANNYFTIASSLTNIIEITMLNQFGEVVYKNEKPRLPQHVNVSNITNGIYFLRIESKHGVMHKKVEVLK